MVEKVFGSYLLWSATGWASVGQEKEPILPWAKAALRFLQNVT